MFSFRFCNISARQMVLSVRMALKEGAMSNWANQFTGYIVALLVIFYMQIAGKLPSVLSLQSDPNVQLVKCGGLFHFIHFFFTNISAFDDLNHTERGLTFLSTLTHYITLFLNREYGTL